MIDLNKNENKNSFRLFFIQHNTFQLERTHDLNKIPDLSIPQISERIAHQISKSGIGSNIENPFIIVSFSLGGVIARDMIL